MITGLQRNAWLTAALIAVFATGSALLSSTWWTVGLAVLLAAASAALLEGNRWRTVALSIAAVAFSVGLLDAFAAILAPAPIGEGVVHVTDPKEWIPPEPVLGYRLLPNLSVIDTASRGSETIYRVTYTSAADGTRTTPPAPPGADCYLFMGASFMFGQGLPDDDTLPAQFARATGFRVRTVNFSAPGYTISHLVRAFEVGLFDRYKRNERVAAAVTWITPSQLEWETGDGEWLGDSPRYVLEDGGLRYTGSFLRHRLVNPLAGLGYLAHKYLPVTQLIGKGERQEEQADLFIVLLIRLQLLASERLGAPLSVIYSWPTEYPPPLTDSVANDRPLLARVLDRLRAAGVPLLSVNEQTKAYTVSELVMPGEGHPNALTTRLVAAELKRELIGE